VTKISNLTFFAFTRLALATFTTLFHCEWNNSRPIANSFSTTVGLTRVDTMIAVRPIFGNFAFASVFIVMIATSSFCVLHPTADRSHHIAFVKSRLENGLIKPFPNDFLVPMRNEQPQGTFQTSWIKLNERLIKYESL
jgi:hypothetical protein